MLNVNISDYYLAHYITSIAWYHNGTKIVSGNKYLIENTTLRINSMSENDAGKYEVKINSISYDSDRNYSSDCDSLVLPLVEALASHAPVTFMVHEQYVPASSIFPTHYLTNDTDGHSIELRSAPLNSSLLDSASSYIDWYKNGTRISVGGNEEELSLIYNSTATDIGDYVRILLSRYYQWDILQSLCRGYYYYLQNQFLFSAISLQISFWSIKHHSE